jgi:FAD/FMN-containing dehydrogenase
MDRREFLTLCALSGMPYLLSACHNTSTPTQTDSAASPSTSTPPASKPDWAVLARSLQGTLILPNSPQYATAHQLFDPRFDHILPAAIAYCTSPADVQASLAFVRRSGLPFAARAGGHSYAGYSTSSGLVVDVTRINSIDINTNSGIATIGAGARLVDVYASLARHGLVIPAGSCPTVGVAGLTLGGGVGVLGRKFGLTCDNLLAAQIVTADGRLLTSDGQHNADLFWALRGGGGGNFGIVTSFTFQTHPVATLSLFTWQWPWSSAATVVDAWQHWAPHAPDELWSNCVLLSTTKGSNPIVLVNGVYVGSIGPLNALLQQLSNQIGVAPTSKYVTSAGILDAMLYEAGCSGKSVSECHLPGQTTDGQVQRAIESAKSDYFTSLLPRQGINNLVNAINARQNSTTMSGGGIGLDAYGGAINRVAANATAFAHRNALFSAQYNADWHTGASNAVVTANHTWLTNTWQSMRPYASGAAYQNYVDPDLANWQQAYYGSNLPRLQHVKATYDPGNFFHFAQSIPPEVGS